MRRLLYVTIPALVEVNDAFDPDEAAKKAASHLYGTVLPLLGAEVIDTDLEHVAAMHDHHSDRRSSCQVCIDTANDERNAQ